MRNVIKFVGFYLILGAACRAGEQLWDENLGPKTKNVISKLKCKFQKKGSN